MLRRGEMGRMRNNLGTIVLMRLRMRSRNVGRDWKKSRANSEERTTSTPRATSSSKISATS